MALKAILASLDGLAENEKALYKAADGKFILDVEGGVVGKDKLEEFRNTNTQLLEKVKLLETSMKQFEGVDPSKYKELMDKLQSQEEQKLIKDGRLDDVINLRIGRMKEDFTAQIQALNDAVKKANGVAEAATGEKNSYIIETELHKAVEDPKYGFHPGSANLLKAQVAREFTIKEGKAVRVKPDGSPVFGADGQPAGLNDFLAEVVKANTWMVKGSSGSGADNRQKTSGNVKTVKREQWNGMSAEARNAHLAAKGEVVD